MNDQLAEAIRAEFHDLVDHTVIDPEFEYRVESVDAVERTPSWRGDLDIIYVIDVRTNRRAQLLGQAAPFDVGDYRGYHDRFYSGWLTGFVQREFDPDERFAITVDAAPSEGARWGDEPFDREVSIATAIEAGIVDSESEFVEKLREYNLDSVVLGGGTTIAGPHPGPIETVEEVCSTRGYDRVLDLFAGSGAFTRVALANGVTRATCVDLDLSSARENLRDFRNKVEFVEGDVFELTERNCADLILADPYFSSLPRFLGGVLSDLLGQDTDILLTAGFREDRAWNQYIKQSMAEHVDEIRPLDNGRTVQFLGICN